MCIVGLRSDQIKDPCENLLFKTISQILFDILFSYSKGNTDNNNKML